LTDRAIFSIEALPDVLAWRTGHEVLAHAHAEFVARVGNALGAQLNDIRRASSARGARLIDTIGTLSDRGLMRAVLAPETTAHLLYPFQHGWDYTADVLERAFQAEQRLEGSGDVERGELWTALGDAKVLQNGEVITGPSLTGLMPLDFDGPGANSANAASWGIPSQVTEAHLNEQERSISLERLSRARDLLSLTGILEFVTTFTKVLVLRRATHGTFSSGSAGRYIGRSVITNPHGLDIDYRDLAEALVHEAIHALLYMHERWQPWVAVALHDPTPRVLSPWTGSVLPVRPFLQASFVWYGILQFWAVAITEEAVQPACARDHLERAAAGFLGPPILDQLSPNYHAAIALGIRNTIRDLQERVRHACS
jgi:hypothetical protein